MSALNAATGRSHSEAPVRILPVHENRDIECFLRLPGGLYADDPLWVPPLLAERRRHLSPRNPYFEHAEWRAWIARRDTRPTGRISAQIDRLHLDRYGDATGFFGMLEAEKDIETFAALLDTAERWLRSRGIRRARGPFNLSINEEAGLLVEGFDTSPMIMMGHARPYYPSHLEANGYRKAKDLLAYWLRLDFEIPKLVQRLMSRARPRLHRRVLRRDRFDEDIQILRSIFNDAWSNNWGFVPFTESEFRDLGSHLKLLIKEGFVQIVELDGEPAAMMVTLPNINEAIRDLNGRLLPVGWIKLLWRLKIRFPKTARVPLMGVRRPYQHGPLGTLLAFELIEASRKAAVENGVHGAELSWILEDNNGMRNIIEAIGGVPYKRYRIYEKSLA